MDIDEFRLVAESQWDSALERRKRGFWALNVIEKDGNLHEGGQSDSLKMKNPSGGAHCANGSYEQLSPIESRIRTW
jgi:hypothetical protein